MAKIYLCKKTENGGLESYIGKDGKTYFELWVAERKPITRSGVHVAFARICNKQIVIDSTASNFVDEIPRDAIKVPHGIAELLYKAKTHYFGYLNLTEDEMEKFLTLEGIDITDGDVTDSTLVFDEAIKYGFEVVDKGDGTYCFKY